MAHTAPLVSHLNGICFIGSNNHKAKISPLLKQSREAQIVISGSVGKGALNRPDDVRKIQDALNHIFGTDGGTQENPLVVDGSCGNLTNGAIRIFQNRQFGVGNRFANGFIETDAPTINQINELFLENTVDPVRLPVLRSFIQRADRTIAAALANMELALPFLNLSKTASAGVFNRADRMRLLNRHFDLDHQSNKETAFFEIRQAYNLMRTAMISRTDSLTGQPAGVGGDSIFVIDPAPRSIFGEGTAYSFPGGFHEPNLFTREFGGLRLDSIYICAKYDQAFAERKVRVIIHELAHFVGKPSNIDGIIDHGYGLAEDPRMVRLTPRQRVLNADTYPNFALEAALGRNLTRWI
jgi:hypothetical protein